MTQKKTYFPIDTATDTAPATPWQHRWCPDCGTISSFGAATAKGQICGTCYLRKQTTGEVKTLPAHDSDRADKFCDCEVCRVRRANTLLNAPGWRANLTHEEGTQSTTLNDASVNPEHDREDALAAFAPSHFEAFVTELPDWLTPHLLMMTANKVATRLRAASEVACPAAMNVLRTLALKVEEDPLTHLVRKLTDHERRALASVKFTADGHLSASPNEHTISHHAKARFGKLSDLFDTAEAIAPYAEELFGPVFLVRDPAAEMSEDEFHERVWKPFVMLATQQDFGVDPDLECFIADVMSTTTFPSCLSILRIVYFSMHPDVLGLFDPRDDDSSGLP